MDIRPWRSIVAALLSVFSGAEWLQAQVVGAEEKVSPFQAVRWNGDATEVEVGGVWYELLALNGIEAKEIVVFAKAEYADKWQKRIGEDLPALLHAMEKPPEQFVTLDVKRLDDGRRVTLSKVEMTVENRRAIWEATHFKRAREAKLNDGDYPPLSPFSGLRWQGDSPEVLVRGTWYALLGIGRLTTQEMLEFADKTHGRNARRRFEEDIWQILAEMGDPPGETVDLAVRRLDDKKEILIEDVAVTAENRRAVMTAARARRSTATVGGSANDGSSGAEARRVERAHAEKIDARFGFLATPAAAGRGDLRMSFEDVAADLDRLEAAMEDAYSYLSLRGVSYREALDAVRLAARDGMNRDDFARRIRKFLALFGDGHTRLRSNPSIAGFLPFLVSDAEGGVVAYSADRRAFLDPECIFLTAIDGVSVDRWIETSARISTQGSPQFARRQSVENLRYIAQFREDSGAAASAKVTVELQSLDRKKKKTVEFALTDQRPLYGTWPRRETGIVADGIGYLRIAEMSDDPAVIAALHADMKKLMSTRGLIIDVRDNGGGSRDITRQLAPYFLDPKVSHHLVNVAAYRMTPEDKPGRKEGYLDDRFLFPSTASIWTTPETSEFLRGLDLSFRPEWRPSTGTFSPWHYFVVAPKPGVGRYSGRVAVLLDAGSFSATDIFLACMKSIDGVVLIGERSGGGSGRARPLRLERSGLELQMSSIISYTADGKLIDGNGIAPHIELKALPTDLIGSTDSTLERAIVELNRR